ncbi:MAG: sialate O-acetylesterase, partial [Bacteroidales bacterium]|nr:sialate O-acetylesterase [Bacteroidales bacterium]
MKKQLLLLLGVFLFVSKMYSQDPDFHIYLCFGQSNMEGSANIEEQDQTVDPRFQMMATVDCEKNNRKIGSWYPAVPPLSQCYVGLSPADYFGRTMVAVLPDSINVGIINVAVGGCDIRLFDKTMYHDYTETYPAKWLTNKNKAYGGNPYQRLIDMAKEAQ